jgi:ketosteroid isomerase-like protein
MSKENVEIVRAMNNAFHRRDVEGFLAHLDPGIEWWPAADEPVTDVHRGHAGVRRVVADILDVVPDLQAEIEELTVVGDRAVVCLHYWGRAEPSGVPVEIRETHTYAMQDGKVVEVREYRTKAEALEAVGLSE